MNIETIDAKHFAGDVADEIVAALGEAIQERGRAYMALAGGSTPGSVYRSLSRPPRAEAVPWSKVSLFLGDERWVPRSDALSNARMIEETLLDGLSTEKPSFYPVDTALPSVEAGARAYEELLLRHVPVSAPSDLPSFDLLLLGMGEDGHTASLFPGSSLLTGKCAEHRLCAPAIHAAEQGKPGATRVTLTPELILNAKRILVIVSGEGKASMVQRVLEGHETALSLPVRMLTEAKGKVTWFLDSGAAKLLRSGRE